MMAGDKLGFLVISKKSSCQDWKASWWPPNKAKNTCFNWKIKKMELSYTQFQFFRSVKIKNFGNFQSITFIKKSIFCLSKFPKISFKSLGSSNMVIVLTFIIVIFIIFVSFHPNFVMFQSRAWTGKPLGNLKIRPKIRCADWEASG